MAFGITQVGAYVPRLRIERQAIAAAHGWMNPGLKSGGKGLRAFCAWDEDAVTMAVEAARDCLKGQQRDAVRSVHLASTTLPYADLSSAVIVAAGLGLDEEIETSNETGSQRAATTALIRALKQGTSGIVIASERPNPPPASVAELQAGAGAAAVALGEEGVIARMLASGSRAVHFVDRFRASEQAADYAWEERWIRDEGYAKLVPEAVAAVLKDAGVAAGEIDHLILPSPIRGIAAAIGRQIGFKGTVAGTFEAEVGYCGVAQGLLMLAEVLATAKPGERILMIGFGQGVDVALLEVTDAVGQASGRGLAGAIADRLVTRDYLRLLSFYDRIALDWGMRGEKAGKAALTEQYRVSHQVDTFTGGRCTRCGTVQFPVLAYCVNSECRATAGEIAPCRLADETGRIFTITSDWLSYHPAPPLAVGFVQFDAGARLLMEVVDAAPEQIVEGTPVRMVFRIKERDRVRGYNRYFWKATPITGVEASDG
jgi:3-hydroxy-3-methylglutaryl CoA synthase